ncbi:glycosyltransferase [Pedococcus aerophilus]|uniref:Glycosyltransferase n=1 Tax=Pedococcus aerophilus TaxID=436356 RepID=A0ABN3UGP5_9MICO
MTTPRRTAVITIAHGRHDHLRGQLWGLAQQSAPADLHVVVAMGDPAITEVVARETSTTLVVAVDLDDDGELPLARARNVGARAAIAAGADRLVFLDVDCIPAPPTLERYAAVLDAAVVAAPVAAEPVAARPVVACGTVAYLPPVDHPEDYRTDALSELADPHPGRPVPTGDEVLVADDLRLFWSLSFALTSADWERLGGFSEDYLGYGAEDTDFGQRVRDANGTMLWVGGAAAYHQHHPTEAPPVRHLVSIVRNANVFRERWGWFPMEGWLAAFSERGLAALDPASDRWVVTA